MFLIKSYTEKPITGALWQSEFVTEITDVTPEQIQEGLRNNLKKVEKILEVRFDITPTVPRPLLRVSVIGEYQELSQLEMMKAILYRSFIPKKEDDGQDD